MRNLTLIQSAKKVSLLLLAAVVVTACNPFNRNTKAGLQVMTNDVSSSVFLDGQFLDKTPYIGKELQPGTYTIRIEPDDSSLAPHETTVNLRKGLLSVITWKPGTRPETSGGVVYEMEPLTNNRRSELSIVSLPDGVIVQVDDEPKEFTPLLIEDIEPGQHEFEVSLPSYETQKHTINVIEGHRMNITVKLAKTDTAVPTSTESTNQDLTDDQTASESADTTETEDGQAESATASAETTDDPEDTILTESETVTINSTNFFVGGQEVLRVRDAADSSGQELGFAEVGATYPYLGQTTNGWYQIEFEGEVGWVSGSFSTLSN